MDDIEAMIKNLLELNPTWEFVNTLHLKGMSYITFREKQTRRLFTLPYET